MSTDDHNSDQDDLSRFADKCSKVAYPENLKKAKIELDKFLETHPDIHTVNQTIENHNNNLDRPQYFEMLEKKDTIRNHK
jgi:hypothetical protein